MPVHDQMLRGVPDCEQCHVPDFLTLPCVTRSGLGELQKHVVGMRNVQVGRGAEKLKARPVSRHGPSFNWSYRCLNGARQAHSAVAATTVGPATAATSAM